MARASLMPCTKFGLGLDRPSVRADQGDVLLKDRSRRRRRAARPIAEGAAATGACQEARPSTNRCSRCRRPRPASELRPCPPLGRLLGHGLGHHQADRQQAPLSPFPPAAGASSTGSSAGASSCSPLPLATCSSIVGPEGPGGDRGWIECSVARARARHRLRRGRFFDVKNAGKHVREVTSSCCADRVSSPAADRGRSSTMASSSA